MIESIDGYQREREGGRLTQYQKDLLKKKISDSYTVFHYLGPLLNNTRKNKRESLRIVKGLFATYNLAESLADNCILKSNPRRAFR